MNQQLKAILTFAGAVFAGCNISGCSTFQRSATSGYADSDLELNLSRDRKRFEAEVAMEQLGRSPASTGVADRDIEAVQDRIALMRAERNLEGKRERDQYFRNKPFMKSDRERLEFLSNTSFDARTRWLGSKGISGGADLHSPEEQFLIEQADIALGMSKQAVRESWGEPDLIEAAGNPMYGNERWHYSGQSSSAEGFRIQQRVVYFEAGRVAGWDSE